MTYESKIEWEFRCKNRVCVPLRWSPPEPSVLAAEARQSLDPAAEIVAIR